MFTSTSLQIGNLSTKQMAVISENILNIDVSYTMDMANQLTFSIIDPGLEMASNNYFQVGVDVVYETTGIKPLTFAGSEDHYDYPIITRIRHIYEISRVSVSQQGSASPIWNCEAMPKAIQQMKRDKKPGNIGGSGYEFVRKAANKYGLKFVGEKSTRIKGGSKNSGSKQQDSVWDRITSIANESQYVVFVVDGTMYFGSQKWLLFRWGTTRQEGKLKFDKNKKPILDKEKKQERYPTRYFIPMEYPGNPYNNKRFELLSLPELSKGENDPMETEGSAIVARDNGVALRPGMTIRIDNIPNMQKYYLITDVSFNEQTTDPVSIEFRTPERLEVNGKTKIPQLPVGKSYESEYFQPTPNIMQTATVGLPVFADTTSPQTAIGTTINPGGTEVKSRLPNSRRQATYPRTKKEIMDLLPSVTNIDPSHFLETGNIDVWNRPLFSSDQTILSKTRCRTLSMYVHETTIDAIDYYVIVERLFCDEGVPVHLSILDAVTKYEAENKHHGIFLKSAGINRVNSYMQVLIKMQYRTVKKRFPSNGEQIWNGTVSLPAKRRCF